MIARYYVDFHCGEKECHTIGESTFPTFEQYSSQLYSVNEADDVALSFVNGYLDVKGLLGKVTPTDIRYIIEFH